MSWELHLRGRAKKNLRKFPKRDQLRVILALREIATDPYSGDIVKIGGEDNVWRRRVESCRIFFEIYTNKQVVYVFRIERRTSKTY
jgi:mRNA-degrading endonuclease RelE of RelBE toxin-antitoxin system